MKSGRARLGVICAHRVAPPWLALIVLAATACGNVATATTIMTPPAPTSEVLNASRLGITPDGWGAFSSTCRPTTHHVDNPFGDPTSPTSTGKIDTHGSHVSLHDLALDDDPAVLFAAGTTCDVAADRSIYWHPTIRHDDAPVEATSLTVTYRRSPTSSDVVRPPDGTTFVVDVDPQSVGWRCGPTGSASPEPPASCDGDRDGSLTLVLALTTVPITRAELAIDTGLTGTIEDVRIGEDDEPGSAGIVFAWSAGSFERRLDDCLLAAVDCDEAWG